MTQPLPGPLPTTPANMPPSNEGPFPLPPTTTQPRRRWFGRSNRRTGGSGRSSGGFFDFLGDVVEGIFDIFD